VSLYKRNKIWHTDFSLNGQRFRMSLDTTDWREAQAKEKELIAQADAGRLNARSQIFAKLAFIDASERHLQDRKPGLAPRSIQTEQERLKPLVAYFQQTPLKQISSDMLRAYIIGRKTAGVANKTINLEIGVVRSLLKRAKRWHLFEDDIRPLPVHHQVGRALTDVEKDSLERMAVTNPAWQNARLAMIIALNTTMRSCELKGLCWRDVDLKQMTITIRQSKTEAGRRVIPLNTDAWCAISELYDRSKKIGAIQSKHFLFPACENGLVDPSRPQKSWRTAWRNLTRAIQCPACGRVQQEGKKCRNEECNFDIHELKSATAHLRFHDLRHHAITELAESQASDQTIMAIAGHVSREMLDHYSHVRLEAKRQAVDALSHNGTRQTGYVTNHVTNDPAMWEILELNRRKDWSGREDLNLRPPGPEPGALPG